jgi:UDP-glucose 4-epimerase
VSSRVVVTGGSGFIGAYLVRRLVSAGWDVTVVDNMVRGEARRLADVRDHVQLFDCDVRDQESLLRAFSGAQLIVHLAAVNGTDNFYQRPELVLDVGLRGALAVVNAGRDANVPDLIVASTAEVYQEAAVIPTPETVNLTIPDSLNPRYSYGGSKIASELIAFNYAREHYRLVQVFRPHNVYGPDMGWKHVVPQFITRAIKGIESTASGNGRSLGGVPFEIQGDGTETRAFCFVDDIVDGIMTMYEMGSHREIYHIGNDEEVTMRDLAYRVGEIVGADLQIQTGEGALGGTRRRCPDITKMRNLGYRPKVNLADGLARTAGWYKEHIGDLVTNELL